MSWKPTTWTGRTAVLAGAALLGLCGYALAGAPASTALRTEAEISTSQRVALDDLTDLSAVPVESSLSLRTPEDVTDSITANVGPEVEVTAVEVAAASLGEQTATAVLTLTGPPEVTLAAAQALNDTPEHTVVAFEHGGGVSTLTVTTALSQEPA